MLKFETFLNECNVLFEDSDFDVQELVEGRHPAASIVAKNGYKVVKTPKTVEDMYKFNLSGERTAYTEDGKYKIHFYNGSTRITDTTNALRTGKQCKTWTLGWHGGDHHPLMFRNSMGDMKFELFLKTIEDGAVKDKLDDEYLKDFSFASTSSEKGIDTFSPFAIGNLKRVKSIPAKPTIQHVLKLIANGQFKYLGRDYSYTDDYAHDAVHGGKIDNVNPISLVQDMVGFKYRRPWTSQNEQGDMVISFGPHSNKSYTLVVDIKGKLKIKV